MKEPSTIPISLPLRITSLSIFIQIRHFKFVPRHPLHPLYPVCKVDHLEPSEEPPRLQIRYRFLTHSVNVPKVLLSPTDLPLYLCISKDPSWSLRFSTPGPRVPRLHIGPNPWSSVSEFRQVSGLTSLLELYGRVTDPVTRGR